MCDGARRCVRSWGCPNRAGPGGGAWDAAIARICAGAATALTAYGVLRRVLEGDLRRLRMGYGDLNDLLSAR